MNGVGVSRRYVEVFFFLGICTLMEVHFLFVFLMIEKGKKKRN